MKKIDMTLDTNSIDKAIKEIKEYNAWLDRKALELQERVADVVAREASLLFRQSTSEVLIGEGNQTGEVEVTVDHTGDVSIVIANGEDAIFMEFGAGVYSNGSVGSSPNPLGTSLGFTIGSFSKSRPEKETWAFYDENGELHITHGTPASMPLYRTLQSVAKSVVSIAKEVFGT